MHEAMAEAAVKAAVEMEAEAVAEEVVVVQFAHSHLGEVVDAGGDRALVGEIARDAPLVLGGGAADER